MGLKLDNVIPWGRSFEEYVRMFHLTPTDLQSSILDCAGGPASFNAGMYRRGHQVISCDPIYQFTVAEIAQRIQDTYSTVVEGVRANFGCYVWRDIESPDRLGAVRMAAMDEFLEDLPQGLVQGRYRVAIAIDIGGFSHRSRRVAQPEGSWAMRNANREAGAYCSSCYIL